MRPRVAVVGAGLSGLAAARELASAAMVTLVDRLPATGGEAGWEHASVRALTDECGRAGVEMQLGATALRWEGGRLLTAAPGAIAWRSFDHLVVATGCRPATRAELRLAGSRGAGVLSALVAIHLAEAGAPMGRRVAILGTTPWAERMGRDVRAAGSRVVVIAPDGSVRPPYADDWWPGWEAVEVEGHPRVTRLVLERDGVRMHCACDSVVLADDPRPLRNVDGALADVPGVSFVQAWEPDPSAKIARSSELARLVLATLKGAIA